MSGTVTEDGSRAIARTAEEGLFQNVDINSLEIQRTAEIIVEHRFSRVALQLPDDMLHVAQNLVHSIETTVSNLSHKGDGEQIPLAVFVLGDTSYGSCCVDEVAAQHHKADFIVHYGQSCMSDPARFPVHFVYGKLQVDRATAIKSILDAVDQENTKVLHLTRDVRYDHSIEAIAEELSSALGEKCIVKVSEMKDSLYLPKTNSSEDFSDTQNSMRLFGQLIRFDNTPSSQVTLVHIGADHGQLVQTALRTAASICDTVLSFDPSTCEVQNASTVGYGLLSKRFVKMQHAKDASVFGIVVGTMGVRGYGEVLGHLSRLIASKGRKSYTFLIGKINPQKLANFPNIDVFVLVACPLNTLIDSKEFYRPVVTPLEVEIALGVREWSSNYSCEFDSLGLENDSQLINKDVNEDLDVPHFSTVSGGLVSSAIHLPLNHPSSVGKGEAILDGTAPPNAVVSTEGKRHLAIRYSSPAADALEQQSFRGLDPSKGDKPAMKAVKGQSGIASALYEISDTKTKDNLR